MKKIDVYRVKSISDMEQKACDDVKKIKKDAKK